MALIHVSLNEDIISMRHFKSMHENLQKEHFLKNPFLGGVIRWKLPESTHTYYTVVIKPIVIKLYYMGLFLALIPILVTGNISIYSLPGIIIFALGFFWSKWFYYVMLRLSLRKKGYRSKVKLIKDDDLFIEVIRNNLDMRILN